MLKPLSILAIPVLANLSETPPPGFELWLRNLLYVAGVLFFFIKGIGEAKALFGRKPSVDHVIEEVKVNIAGLVTKTVLDEKLEEERRRDTGLEKQIAECRHKLPTLEQAMQSGDDEIREEVKEAVNRLSDQMQAGFAAVEEKRATNIGVLHRDLKAAEVQIAGIRSDTESHTRHLSAMQTTLENILQRLPRKTS